MQLLVLVMCHCVAGGWWLAAGCTRILSYVLLSKSQVLMLSAMSSEYYNSAIW